MILLLATSAVFALGLYAVLTRRDVVGILIGIELMMGGAIVLTVALALGRGAPAARVEAFGLLLLVVAAAGAAVALALLLASARASGRTRVDDLTEVKG
jgi:NADH-quinone oxidoreductase subunit K